jgi:hypothetical protein
MPPEKTFPLELVPVQANVRGSEEDWYLHLHGQSYGYLYRSTDGYAVGIGEPEQEVQHCSIEPSKDAALAAAQRYLGLLKAAP